MLQRSPTYIAARPDHDPVADTLRKRLPPALAHRVIRGQERPASRGFYHLARRRPERVKSILRKFALHHLDDPAYLDEHFTPSYQPWDQRLCVVPQGDLFAAISAGRAAMATAHIDRFVATGIRLTDGRVLEADVVVTATGLSVLAIGGAELTVDGRKVNLGDTVAYRGTLLAASRTSRSASATPTPPGPCERTCPIGYVCRLLAYMARHGYTTATPGIPAGGTPPAHGADLGLRQRGADVIPKQGDQSPWRLPRLLLSIGRAVKRVRDRRGEAEFVPHGDRVQAGA